MPDNRTDIQVVLEALNKTQAAFSQALGQMAQLDRANLSSARTQQQSNSAVQAGIQGLVGLRLGYVAAAAAAGLYLRNSAQNINSLAKEARAFETTTDRLSAFKFAMAQSNITSAEASQQLNNLVRAMEEAAGDPTSRAANAFKAAGIAIKGLDQRDVLSVMTQLADVFQKHSGAAAKAAIAQDLFGKSSREVIDFLNQGPAAIQKNIDLLDALGGTVKSTTAQEMERLARNVNVLKGAFAGLANTLLDSVAPALSVITEEFIKGIHGETIDPKRIHEAILGKSGAAAAAGAGTPASGSGEENPPLTNPASTEQFKAANKLFSEINRAEIETLAEQLTDIEKMRVVAAAREVELHNHNLQEMSKLTLVSEQTMDALSLAEKQRHEDAIKAIEIKALQEGLEEQHRIAEAKKRIRDQELTGTSEMFGNLATVAKAFGKEGLTAYKVFATAQALIDGYKAAIGAYSSVVSIPYVGPVLAPIAAGAAIGAAAAQVAAIQSVSFASGGYTGDGGRFEPAGEVHKGEVVINAPTVKQFGLDHFAKVYFNGRMPGHVGGGFAGGGFAGTLATATATQSASALNVSILDGSRNSLREWMAKDGARIVLGELQRRGNNLR